MMDKELIKEHIALKNKRGFTNKKYDTFFDGKVLQICFYSKGCRFSKNGNCIMCDYGLSRKDNLKSNDIKEIMAKTIEGKTPKVLLINSLGSIFDYLEMPKENIITLLDCISKTNINVVVFESYYTSINKEILDLINEKLKPKEIEIELGFESYNDVYRRKCLNKIIDNEKFKETISLIKDYGFKVEANCLFGMPFISLDKQIEDTIESIKWLFNNGVDLVNLFPMNIKPYTLLYKLYKEGIYKPVKHKDFITLLKNIPIEYIDKIYLCWYGNRTLDYSKDETVLPITDDYDYEMLMKFYQDFNIHKDKDYRLNLLKDI